MDLQRDASPSKKGAPSTVRPWLWALAVVWLTLVISGLWVVWAYENRPGVGASAPRRWPVQSALVPSGDGPTLVFVAHPRCTCTRASLDELGEALARAPKRPRTYVLFLRPSAFEAGWEQTDLWRRAAALPGATVVRDDDGREAQRFGVETSGQTLLYDQRGSLMFSGGVTGARGHAGTNAGAAALVSWLTRGEAPHSGSSVFGCPLFAQSE